jgi:hypothetical protein
LAEHALDTIPIPIAAKVAGNGRTAIGFGRDDRQDALHQQVFAKNVAIIALVGEQGLDSAIVGCFPGSQDEPESASLIVAAGVDFARKAAA